jgi:hypothetical protein
VNRACASFPRIVLALVVTVVIGALTSSAGAEISGAGPDESIAHAYGPLQANLTYTGAFAGANDVDYLSFRTTAAGQIVQFTIRNTTPMCADPNNAGCPVYATLMDATGQNQLGGSDSDAGTIATYGDTEIFRWTFAQPGTYYLLMESDGDLPSGSPAYAVALGLPGTGSGTGTGSGSGSGSGSGTGSGSGSANQAGAVRSLTVLPHQRGRSVAATVVLARHAAWLRAMVLAPRPRRRPVFVASVTSRNLGPGVQRVSVRLPLAYRRELTAGRKLAVLLRITVANPAGPPTSFTRNVSLKR